jgi:hypothetical protein
MIQDQMSRALNAHVVLASWVLGCLPVYSLAAEGFRLRHPPVGLFGPEIAARVDNPGFFGTAALSHARVDEVVGNNGDTLTLPARVLPLPTGAPTGGAVPNGTYALQVPAGRVDLSQNQTQLNLLGGFVTRPDYAGGSLSLRVNVPFVSQSRSFAATQPLGTVVPVPSAQLPAPLRGAINAVASAANAQVQSALAATGATHNTDVSGLGDIELSAAWVRRMDRLRVAANLSLHLPTGKYDRARGPNPGFGDFYTLQPGVALTYAMGDSPDVPQWAQGVSLAGRVAYGINSTNRDTDYRTGNFIALEGAAVKVMGPWAVGANLLSVQQVTDDRSAGVMVADSRYRTHAAGPFLAYKFPGRDLALNMQLSQSFGGRNALVARTLQLRLVGAWQ